MKIPSDNEMIVGDKILPLEDVQPGFDPDAQYIEPDGFEVLEDKVIKKYKVVEMFEGDTESREDSEKQQAIMAVATIQAKQMVLNEELTGGELSSVKYLFKDYDSNFVKYEEDEILNVDGILFRVVLDHTSQPDWVPSENPTLYWRAFPKGTVGRWIQPAGQVGAYKLGDRVKHNGSTWICTAVDGGGLNIWEPGVYGWELI